MNLGQEGYFTLRGNYAIGKRLEEYRKQRTLQFFWFTKLTCQIGLPELATSKLALRVIVFNTIVQFSKL